MKNFTHWGIKIKKYPEKNYKALFSDLKTVRLGTKEADKLEYGQNEFYDIGIGTKCTTGRCPWCYVAANEQGEYFSNISETWNKWINTLDDNDKPFQVAIGSTCEPTEHSEFIKFLETIYNSGVVPNYTTNGVLLARDDDYSANLLSTTELYCGGVAVSCNKHLEQYWKKAVDKLMKIDVHINLHYIINDESTVDEFMDLYNEYHNEVLYFVVLPLMSHGRGINATPMNEKTWKYFESRLNDLDEGYNIAFGANFYEYLKESSIETYCYPPESFSANMLLKKDEIVLTPSSFDLNPVKIIKL